MSDATAPTTRTILVLARAIIEDQGKWTTGANARDAWDEAVGPTSSKACCWCARGAVLRVMPAYSPIPFSVLTKAGRELFHEDSTVLINDAFDHADVIRLFDRAIELAGEAA